MALPGSFSFGMHKPSSAPAKGYSQLLPPEAGLEFTENQIITINIPAGRAGEYLRSTESDLRFRVKNTAAAAGGGGSNSCSFSGGAYACIEKLEVYCGGVLLSSVEDYGSMHSAFYDTTVSATYRRGLGSMLHGVADEELGCNTDALLKGASIAEAGGAYNVVLQLINPLVGCTAERAIPIGLMSSDISIRVTMASTAKAFVSTGTPVIQYDNVNFNAVVVQLDPAVDQAVAQDNNGVIAWHGADFRHYAHSVTSATTFDIAQLPIRFSSCRYAFHFFRKAVNLTDQNAESVCGREKATLISYSARMGSQMVPQRPIEVSTTDQSQVVVELCRLFGKYETYGEEMGIVFTDTDLFSADDVGKDGSNVADQGTFLWGLDWTPFGGSRDAIVNSGLNLVSTPVAIEMKFTSVPHNVRLTTFANYDTLYTLSLDTGLLDVAF